MNDWLKAVIYMVAALISIYASWNDLKGRIEKIEIRQSVCESRLEKHEENTKKMIENIFH